MIRLKSFIKAGLSVLLFSIVITLASCPGSLANEGVITINIGAERSVGTGSSLNNILPYLDFRFILNGPSGEEEHIIKGKTTASFTVAPGAWDVTVEVCVNDTEILFAAAETTSINVTVGQSNPVSITLKHNAGIIFHTVGNINWMDFISNYTFAYDSEHCIIITGNCTSSGSPNTTFGISGQKITIIGNDHSITLNNDNTGRLINLTSGWVTVTIKDLKLVGHAGNNSPLVSVVSSSFIMEGTSSISGNKNNTDGGGVRVEAGGSFTMNDGIIYGNEAGNGGGVYVDPDGIFIMDGGTVYGNEPDLSPVLRNDTASGGNGAALYLAINAGQPTSKAEIAGEVIEGDPSYFNETIRVVNGEWL